MRVIFAVCIALVVAAASAEARDIYVSNVAGDDRAEGSSPRSLNAGGGPVRSLRRAMALARPGDRVVLENTGEPYRESFTIDGSINGSGRPFVLEGNGAVLDGSVPVPARAWKHHYGKVFRFRPRRMSRQMLYLNGRPLRYVEPKGDWLETMQPLEWTLLDGYVYFCVHPVRLPQDYELYHTLEPVGVTLYRCRNVVIADLIVQGFQIDGINAHDGVRDVRLVRVTARGNARSGVAVQGSSQLALRESILGNNGEAQLLTAGYGEAWVEKSDLYANPAPAYVVQGGEITIGGEEVSGVGAVDVLGLPQPAAGGEN